MRVVNPVSEAIKKGREMNKKEISEIRKQLTPERCCITRICGCYVVWEKEKRMEMKEAFLSLPDEVLQKYLELLKKSLSGTLGKNLLNLDFPLEQEREEGMQHFLMELKASGLTEDELVEQFYDKIIENLEYSENYLILLVHAVYDIPGKSSDGLEMFDASDHVYEHLICSICPVKQSKGGLAYQGETNQFTDRIRDYVVDPPMLGFLFPLYQDRNPDVHGMLYYSKNAEQLQGNMIETLFGCQVPLSAATQKDSFNSLVESTLGEDCAYDTVISIHEKLNEMLDAQKDEPDPLALTKPEVRRLLEESGVPDDHLEDFDEQYAMAAGSSPSLMAANITNTRKTEIKTPDIVVSVDPSKSSMIETRVIDGVKCLVIPVDGEVEVNGIHVK